MEAEKSHGGYVTLGWSGDVVKPYRYHWMASNHQGIHIDGQTIDEARKNLERELSLRFVEQMEPERLTETRDGAGGA